LYSIIPRRYHTQYTNANVWLRGASRSTKSTILRCGTGRSIKHTYCSSAERSSSDQVDSTVRWPSGLRRQLKVLHICNSLVRKGVGSNPTLINIYFVFCNCISEPGIDFLCGYDPTNLDFAVERLIYNDTSAKAPSAASVEVSYSSCAQVCVWLASTVPI
jgi:hypothetical protein